MAVLITKNLFKISKITYGSMIFYQLISTIHFLYLEITNYAKAIYSEILAWFKYVDLTSTTLSQIVI